MERDAGKAGGQQPREGELGSVSASAGPAAGAAERSKDGPVGGSPGVPAAADGGERSRSCRQVSPARAAAAPGSAQADSRHRREAPPRPVPYPFLKCLLTVAGSRDDKSF